MPRRTRITFCPTRPLAKTEFHFVVLNWCKWASVLQRSTAADVSRLAPCIVSNEDIWVVLTYLQLTTRGFNASIGPTPLRDKINICDGIHVVPEHLTPDMFVVGCRGDGHYPALCHTVIHQNTLRLPGQPSIYIPQWAQPGLRPRDPTRAGMRNVAFFGHSAVNLMPCFHDPGFQSRMHAHGYSLLIRDRNDQVQWHDYSDIDLVLSIRNIPRAHLMLKPANKLTNAWLAGTPAIIGAEPAVHALRRSELDYFEAQGPEQVLHLLSQLRDRRALYDAMVSHGRKRGASYADDAIARRWKNALRAILPRFHQWRRNPSRLLDRCYFKRLHDHRRALQRHERDIHRSYLKLGFDRRWWASTQPPPLSTA